MFSLHVKATMMKVSHPIVFGHAVKVFYKDAFAKHQEVFDELGVNVNNGMSDLYDKIESLPASQREEIIQDIHAVHEHRPELAMVDSAKGITNFHSPSDVIVDASMPAMIRLGGKMYGADGRTKDTKAVNPESTFSRIYQEMINWCKTHGQFDPTTMGTVPNVGLMAQKAEEYGSTTRRSRSPRTASPTSSTSTPARYCSARMSRSATSGGCRSSRTPRSGTGSSWPSTAGAQSGMTVVFWLDTERPHEAELRKKVKAYLKDHDTEGLHIQIMPQVWAMRYTLERVIRGQDTIAATGNILRDYLTDLFPILELGTSAKMLSIVPLMAGGGMYETGAGGSAPKHVHQLVEENHLRWDSLGEFLALGASLEDLGSKTEQQAGHAAGHDAGRRDRQAAWRTTRARHARPASSTTAAASSISPCTGRRSSPSRPRTRNSPTTSPNWPRRWRRTKTRSCPNLLRFREIRWTSAATTIRTGRRP